MPVQIIIGAQWGDEGKGRVADWLAADADVVARYAGGDNAGHTVYVGDEVFKMHLIPSGIIRDEVACVLGNGMVVNPLSLLREIDTLAAQGVDISPQKLIISNRAHLITAAHVALDGAAEAARGSDKIGTTLRGIGPAYMDKTGRRGLRAGEMATPSQFVERLGEHLAEKNVELEKLGAPLVDIEAAVQDYATAAERLAPYLQDTTRYLYHRLRDGASVLCEGAQGTLLDVDHGNYPFVTSSSPTAGGALTGLGLGPKYVERVVGVAKAFSTRVGSGPMPTELNDEIAERLRGTGENFWDEYGTTTGRPRRTGWLDTVMLRYATQVNGFTELVITKLDILSGFDQLKVAVAYELDGQRYDFPPGTTHELDKAVPIYETLAGWAEDVSGARQPADLPAAARAYIDRIAALCDVPIVAVSVGPERDQLVMYDGS